ncbi:MAG: cell filamentation protein Fic, partial [Gemmatimonadota bacterium]|nr:cell filamentation protein Fic [Gemmatimonadota bacterium]
MVETAQERPTPRPAGYAALIERYNLDAIPNWHQSKVATSGIHRVNVREDVIEEIYPLKYWPGETLGNHL